MKNIYLKVKNDFVSCLSSFFITFTLIILISMIIPTCSGSRIDYKTCLAGVRLISIRTALEKYKLDNGRYPTLDQGLNALVEKPETAPIPPNWKSKYLDEVPKDPWDNKIYYICPGVNNKDSFDLWSFGSDGIPGTEDDVTNRERED